MAFPKTIKNTKPAKKKASLEQAEEKQHKDLDDDGEKGESPAHKAKVLGSSSATPTKGKKGVVPPVVKKKGGVISPNQSFNASMLRNQGKGSK